MSRIETLCFELTASCPLRCVHCSAFASPSRAVFLDPRKVVACLSVAAPLEEIYLSGGEPFSHPGLVELVRSACVAARKVVLYSSGTMKSGNRIAPISRSLLLATKHAGVTRIDLSLYDADPAIHDAVTKTDGSLQATLETARRIRSTGMELGIHYVPVAPALKQVRAVAIVAQHLGASRLHILALSPQGRGLRLDSAQSNRVIADSIRQLLKECHPYELLLSSHLRRIVGVKEATVRDQLRPAFVDVRGFVYPREDMRSPQWRSVEPIEGPLEADRILSSLGECHA